MADGAFPLWVFILCFTRESHNTQGSRDESSLGLCAHITARPRRPDRRHARYTTRAVRHTTHVRAHTSSYTSDPVRPAPIQLHTHKEPTPTHIDTHRTITPHQYNPRVGVSLTPLPSLRRFRPHTPCMPETSPISRACDPSRPCDAEVLDELVAVGVARGGAAVEAAVGVVREARALLRVGH